MPGFLDWLFSLPARYPELRLDLLGELLLAAVLGGAIGWERERAHKPAGLRTNILICIGAALLADLSTRVAARAGPPADPGRIAAQIVSGIGFLGAGTIIQARGSVTGLTTAATMWVVAAIGMAVGFGYDMEAAGATVIVLIALIPLGWIEGKSENDHHRFHHRRRDDPPRNDRPDDTVTLGREDEG
jgi:putative Mg2+ transporter-C (MgtC) family protein